MDLGKPGHCPGKILVNCGYSLQKLGCDIYLTSLRHSCLSPTFFGMELLEWALYKQLLPVNPQTSSGGTKCCQQVSPG